MTIREKRSPEEAAGIAAASYAIRHGGGDKATLRDLLYALDVLPDPDVAARHAHRTVVNSRPPIDEQTREQVLAEFLDGRPVEEIAADIGRTVPVTRRIINSEYAVSSRYITDPDDRLAWMLANAPEYVCPAASERRAAA